MEESKKCHDCQKLWECMTSKELWVHEVPIILLGENKMLHDVEVYCSEFSGSLEGSAEELGKNFALFVFNHASPAWLVGFLDTFKTAIPEELVEPEKMIEAQGEK